MGIASFAAGFVSGWLVRSTVESSRDLAVKLIAAYEETAKKVRYAVVAEREFLDDLFAEAKMRLRTEDLERDEDEREHAPGMPSRVSVQHEPAPHAQLDGDVVP